MIKACIFDLDGTVCDTLDSISYFANKALNKYGLVSIEKERYKMLVGNGASVLVHRMIEETGGSAEQEIAVCKEYNTSYDSNFLYLTKPYDGIIEMLRTFNSAGIKTAIISNKPDSTTKKISEALFGDLICKCYGGRKGVPLKPDPTAILSVMDEMKVKPCECVYCGDTGTYMLAGKRAGAYTIGVLWGFRKIDELQQNGADLIVSHPSEITQAVLSAK